MLRARRAPVRNAVGEGMHTYRRGGSWKMEDRRLELLQAKAKRATSSKLARVRNKGCGWRRPPRLPHRGHLRGGHDADTEAASFLALAEGPSSVAVTVLGLHAAANITAMVSGTGV